MLRVAFVCVLCLPGFLYADDSSTRVRTALALAHAKVVFDCGCRETLKCSCAPSCPCEQSVSKEKDTTTAPVKSEWDWRPDGDLAHLYRAGVYQYSYRYSTGRFLYPQAAPPARQFSGGRCVGGG